MRAPLQALTGFALAMLLAQDVTPLPASELTEDQCVVAHVIDGDTLICANDVRIRLLLIDAPEMSQAPYGPLAKQMLEYLAPVGAKLRVEYDVQREDQYGRTLAYLYSAQGQMLNAEILRAGFAVIAVYPPNVRHVDVLRATSEAAKNARRGLWGTPAFSCSPADHRDGRC